MADYNGVTLPDLPSDVDTTQYPYASIVYAESMYILIYAEQAMFYSTTESAFGHDTSCRYMYFTTNGTTWECILEDTSGVLVPVAENGITWSNHDIMNLATGEVYFPSSVKPLYYYNGVRLPQIPQDVIAEYPYAVISKMTEGEEEIYTLLVHDKSLYMAFDETFECSMLHVVSEANGKLFSTVANGTNWSLDTDEIHTKAEGCIFGLVAEDMVIIWSNFDIPNGSADATEIYRNASEPLMEDTPVAITVKTLCDLGNAIREASGDSTLRKPSEMIAKVKTLIGGVSGGYVVSFYDENEEMLAVHSIKQGHSTNAPNYTCKKWIDTDGNVITFPYTPTEGICFYANSDETFDDVLYEFYDIDKAVYPYVCIVLGGTYNNSCDIFFGKTISTNSTSNITLTDVMYKSANFNLNISDFANIEEVIDLVITNVPKLQERSDWSTGGGEKYYLYANFENNLTNIITKYRLDQ